MLAAGSTQQHSRLPPTSSVELARKYLQNLSTGGKTPLHHGLLKGYEVIQSELRRDPYAYPFFILISKGRANVYLHGESALEETIEIASHIKAEGIHSTRYRGTRVVATMG
jgi:magnesium chelatase subunit D